MRGPSKAPPKYRKHKKTGQAVVTLNSKDFYLGPHGTKTSKQEYDRLIGEWLANGRQLPVEPGRTIKVAELAAKYWIFAKLYYVKDGKPTDEQACLKVAIRHLKAVYGKTPVDEFGPLSLAALQRRMIDLGNSRTYINRQVARIKRIFAWGVSKEIVPVEVHQRLITVQGLRKGRTDATETGPVLPVDNKSIQITIENLASPVVADMIRFQRLTGCRPGELMAIRPRDIDRTSHKGVWLYYPESHKMQHKGRHRVIVIGPKAQAILAKYLLRDKNNFCFVRRNGQRFQRWHYAQRIKYACEKAGIEAWAPNRLRHTTATEIRKQHGLEAAQVVAGHAQANVTQIYAERDLDRAIQIMREVG